MRNAGLAAGAVLIVSLAARLLVPGFSLYLEPWELTRQWHLWQLVTWIPAGASLTFLLHAPLLGFAISRGVSPRLWLGVTFIAGVLTTLLGSAVPAIYSCTFTGAGVGASASLSAWASTLKGPRRLAATGLALVPALLDGLVDGLYVLVPFGFAFVVSGLWVRWSRRTHPKP
jgi:hypothetical protein